MFLRYNRHNNDYKKRETLTTMKFKKLLFGIGIIAVLLSSGCAKQKKQTEPVLTKTQVIEKSQKSFKSGQAKQIVNLKTDTSSQIVGSTFTFGGNPTVFHVNYQTQNKNKTRNMEEWVSNTGAIYLNGQSTWYKDQVTSLTGHSYADMLDSIMNNKMLMDPPKSLIDSYKMTRKGNTYTLKATIKDKKILNAAAEPVFLTNTQGPQQLNIYRKLAKAGKFTNMQVKLVLKNKKLDTFNYQVNLKLGKFIFLSAGQSYGNIGSHDFLKIPNNVLNAKPLPKQNKKK